MEEEKHYSIYYGQICQDIAVTENFRRLHKQLVDLVVKFCKDNSVEIDDFYLHADGLRGSIPYGSWQACTDSGLEMYRNGDIETGNDDPFLFSM